MRVVIAFIATWAVLWSALPVYADSSHGGDANASASATANGGTHTQTSNNTNVNTNVVAPHLSNTQGQGQQQGQKQGQFQGQGQSQSVRSSNKQGQAQNNAQTISPSQSTKIEGDVYSPSVFAPNLTSAPETCMGSVSAGASYIAGISFGKTYESEACNRRMDARLLAQMGLGAAALARLAQGEDNANALNAAGIEFPQLKSSVTEPQSVGAAETPRVTVSARAPQAATVAPQVISAP